MLIVCEGEVTEPEYFSLLRRMAIDGAIWAAIEIRPKPKVDENQTSSTRSPHKSTRPKRKLIPVAIPDEADPIEKKYDIKSQPSCWVKEARDGLKDDTFEEVWAVFDDDGRNKTANAFQLAREKVSGKVVNIAFSSIAFEHWILLHFERNASAFKRSLCRTGHQIHECGSSTSTDDCGGTHCLIGYLRHNHYLVPNSSTKKPGEISALFESLTESNNRWIAYANAAWLRHVVPHDPLKPYLVNPFSNVDLLVQRLLGEEQEIVWGAFDQAFIWQEIEFKASVSNKILVISLKNLSISTRLINGSDIPIFFSTVTQNMTLIPQISVVLAPNEHREIVQALEESTEVLVQICSKGVKLFVG
ncbi:hypothetical protein Halhy_5187 [Haliscomenobacter hydrossis DSM 1100]|uniref:RloB-like protein n=2 Tax=Haliscomenobacter TaxID=2349 RepID=F4L4R5_HALH1|nr:hypothetical protein Halhy_5187 [Haliscomenobacter hydrossis DSM 1100]